MAKTVKKAAAKKAAPTKPAAAKTTAPKKKSAPAVKEKLKEINGIPVHEFTVVMVADLPGGHWQSLQQWSADNEVFVHTRIVNQRAAIPVETYKRFLAEFKG